MDAVKAAPLLVLAALVQVSILTTVGVADASPDLVLVLLVVLALLRGPVFGAVAGFWVGLVLDTAAFDTLGLSSLLLTLAGYFAGRFGQVTTKDSAHPQLVAVALATLGVSIGSLAVHFMLGTSLAAGRFVVAVLLPGLALNLLLTYPLWALVRRLFPPVRRRARGEGMSVTV